MEGKPETKHENKIPLWKDEDHWQSITFALAGVSFCILAVVCVFWVFNTKTDVETLQRVQIIAPFALFAGATVTFCTVIWRGLISARQANLQREQIEKLAIQIIATDENNLAQNLQKGAELLGATESPPKIAGGIALIQSVAAAKNPKFSKQAMNLIADFIDAETQGTHKNQVIMTAIRAINDIWDETKVFADRSIHFKEGPGVKAEWHLLRGVSKVAYTGGKIRDQTITVGAGYQGFRKVNFLKCSFQRNKNDRIQRFGVTDATFTECNFETIVATAMEKHTFVECNFSNTLVRGQEVSEMSDMRTGKNWFDVSNPPRFEQADIPIKWEDYFEPRTVEQLT